MPGIVLPEIWLLCGNIVYASRGRTIENYMSSFCPLGYSIEFFKMFICME